MEDQQLCQIYSESNCSIPELSYQFRSVNVEVILFSLTSRDFFQFGYFCKDAKTVKSSISVQMFGVLVGSVVFGQLSDSFGRKAVGIWNSLELKKCLVNAPGYVRYDEYLVNGSLC